jgi:hypothetical protein
MGESILELSLLDLTVTVEVIAADAMYQRYVGTCRLLMTHQDREEVRCTIY